jgi:murein DD-endopeptidase MepM/ murein hydrolase activator NlpD
MRLYTRGRPAQSRGDEVTINDVLGTTGRTGTTTEDAGEGGYHLHFEIRIGLPGSISSTSDVTSIHDAWDALDHVDPLRVFDFPAAD